MAGADAESIIAVVADELAVWDRAVAEYPREAMREVLLAALPARARIDVESAIA